MSIQDDFEPIVKDLFRKGIRKVMVVSGEGVVRAEWEFRLDRMESAAEVAEAIPGIISNRAQFADAKDKITHLLSDAYILVNGIRDGLLIAVASGEFAIELFGPMLSGLQDKLNAGAASAERVKAASGRTPHLSVPASPTASAAAAPAAEVPAGASRTATTLPAAGEGAVVADTPIMVEQPDAAPRDDTWYVLVLLTVVVLGGLMLSLFMPSQNAPVAAQPPPEEPLADTASDSVSAVVTPASEQVLDQPLQPPVATNTVAPEEAERLYTAALTAFLRGPAPLNDPKTMAMLKQAAAAGHGAAQAALAYLYHLGIGVAIHHDLCRAHAAAAAEAGQVLGEFFLVLAYYEAQQSTLAPEPAATGMAAAILPVMERAASSGNALVQDRLGHMYLGGIGIAPDTAQAAAWFRKAAAAGVVPAQKQLASMYAAGIGIEKNLQQATYWYRQAAGRGDAAATYRLGVCYESGDGVENDLEAAIKWYHAAADRGDADAAYRLGVLGMQGNTSGADLAAAVQWLKRAAAGGQSHAQYNLGVLYLEGRESADIVKDAGIAYGWFVKAAFLGHSRAQYNLGVMYNTGYSLNKDTDTALKWFRMSAAQNNANAQYQIGLIFASRTPPDPVRAEEWFRVAADNGHEKAMAALADYAE